MKRFEYLDTTKAYLIFLVILGHVLIVMNPGYENLYLSLIQEFIYSFHMAAFFVIHGVLFNNEKNRSIPVRAFLKKRLYTLVVPYIFFEILGIATRFFTQKQSISVGLKNLFTIRCNVGADWFLPAMFIGSVLFIC